MALVDAQPFLTARSDVRSLVEGSPCKEQLTQLVARYFRSDKPGYQSNAVKGFLTACELYIQSRDPVAADVALDVCRERLILCGTNKRFASDFLKSVRLSVMGSWASDDRDFRKSVADDLKTAKKAASKSRGIEESQKREAKLSSIVIRFLTELQGIDLSPQEKRMLMERVGGAIGLTVSHSPSSAKPDKKTTSGKKKPRAMPVARSAEEQGLMDQVAQAASAVVSAKKAAGKQLPPDNTLILALSEAKARLAAFRSEHAPPKAQEKAPFGARPEGDEESEANDSGLDTDPEAETAH